MWFVVPMAHRVVAMNGYHRDTGHQGQQWMQSLLQDWLLWPGLAMQMQKVISSCVRCIQHDGAQAKAPLQAILVISPSEFLHVDFTGIEMTMELDQPPNVLNVLLFCDHFTRYIMAYVTTDQTAKKMLLIFCGKDTPQSSEHWPSSWVTEEPTLKATSSASCVSSWIFRRWELCLTTPRLQDKLNEPTKWWCGWLENWVKIRMQTGLSIYQSWYMLTTPQDSPLQDTAHTIWCLAMTMPTHWLLFSHYCEHRETPACQLLHYWFMWVIAQNLQGSTSQFTSKAKRQRWCCDYKANSISLEPGDLVLAKSDAHIGRRKVKDQWEEEPCEVECRIA